MDYFEKALIQVKYDLPDTFKLSYIIADSNTGTSFNGGHLKGITPRLNKLYKRVKSVVPSKPVFNRYINSIFGTSLKDMKSNLFLPFKEVLDTKLTAPINNFVALTTPVEYIQVNDKIIPIYNKDNVLYIKLSDCDIFNTTPLEFLELSGVVIWKSAKFKSYEILQNAVEQGNSFWRYLTNLYGARHHLALYAVKDLSLDRQHNIAYFPKLRSYGDVKDIYFGKQDYWYKKLADPTEDVYINLNRFRQFLMNYKKAPHEVQHINTVYSKICSELFSGTNFSCLESYYTIPSSFLQGFFSYKTTLLNTITTKVVLENQKLEQNRYLVRQAASGYISNIIFPETDTISYNEWSKDTYIASIEILKDINKNMKEVILNVRDTTKNRIIRNTPESR